MLSLLLRFSVYSVTESIIIAGFDYDADAKVEVEVHGLKGGKLDVIESFDKMGLREDLIRGIYAYGKNESRSSWLHKLSGIITNS